jgi:hypothetical protein
MLAKLLLVILTTGGTAAGLLTTRHRCIELAHEMSGVHRQMVEDERTLWALRAEIAARVQPGAVRDLMEESGIGWEALIPPPVEPLPPAPEAGVESLVVGATEVVDVR